RSAPGCGYLAVDRVGTVGRFTSIALDKMHLRLPGGRDTLLTVSRAAYYDATEGNLKLALQTFTVSTLGQPASVWSTQIVDSKGDVGLYAALALDQGAPRIAYWDRSREDVRYASWNGATFDSE